MMDDWKLLHRNFENQIKKVNEYLETEVNIEDVKWFLIYPQTQEYKEDLLFFNIAVLLGEDNLTLIRDITIKISPLLFVAYTNQCGFKGCDNITTCLDFFNKMNNNAIIKFSYVSDTNHIFSFEVCNSLSITDDIGTSFTDFDKCVVATDVDIPSCLLNKTFAAVGIPYYAPYSTSEINCILFAQENNQYDNNAVEIRRWFPHQRKDGFPMKFPYSYSYGYISRSENEELHKFMINNDCRILLGKVSNKTVTILGTVALFKTMFSAYLIPNFIFLYLK